MEAAFRTSWTIYKYASLIFILVFVFALLAEGEESYLGKFTDHPLDYLVGALYFFLMGFMPLSLGFWATVPLVVWGYNKLFEN